MKKYVIFVILLVTFCLSATWAQGEDQKKEKKEKKLCLWGMILDSFTKSRIPNAKVVVLRPDSSLVDSVGVLTMGYDGFSYTQFNAYVPAKPAKYVIKAMAPGYETICRNFEIKYVARNNSFEVPAIRMHRIQRSNYDKDGGDLKEVVVKATKVKMVYKGDTIIYNADAFNVPEGSMLDGLIKQLPGVELKDNGEIFVNGKKVENLTLNGANFFKGKNKIMLENLPYYTVKNVQVYNKRTPKSEFLGRDVEQKEYTMDVVLKKEYSVGGTVNLETGYGTDNRYMAKGFGLRYTDKTRGVLFGGMNNLNEYIDYDNNGIEHNRTQASGDRDVKTIGGAWSLHTPEERITNELDYKLNWEDVHSESHGHSEDYQAGASTFGQSQSISNNRPFMLSARNTFSVRKPFYLISYVHLSYNNQYGDSENCSLTANDRLMNDSVNHTWRINRKYSKGLEFLWGNHCDFKLPWGDEMSIGINLNWEKQWDNNSYSQNRYTYYNIRKSDKRNQYASAPMNDISVDGFINYTIRLKYFSMSPELSLSYSYNKNESKLYRLDWLGAEWDVGGMHSLGTLPATKDSLMLALDAPNSSDESYRDSKYGAGMVLRYSRTLNAGFVYCNLGLTEQFRKRRMFYDGDVLHTTMSRNYSHLQVNWNFNYSFDNYHKELYSYGNNSFDMPKVDQMTDVTHDSNPLFIMKGNPNLKPQTYWWGAIGYRARVDSIDQSFNIGLTGSIQHNALSLAHKYDRSTGVRTSWTENVNGNWYIQGNIGFDRSLGKRKFWHIGNTFSCSLSQNTDQTSLLETLEPERNRVTSTHLSYDPSLRFQKDELNFTLKGSVGWRHINRSIDVSELPTNMYDFSYGFNVNYRLPWNFVIDTDMQMHSRRGYADSEMNDNRLYWDATLTKSWKKGRWVAKLKGYDLLGQVTHWQYSVNTQRRYEAWTNNMRRYVLLSIAYRFSLTPQKNGI